MVMVSTLANFRLLQVILEVRPNFTLDILEERNCEHFPGVTKLRCHVLYNGPFSVRFWRDIIEPCFFWMQNEFLLIMMSSKCSVFGQRLCFSCSHQLMISPWPSHVFVWGKRPVPWSRAGSAWRGSSAAKSCPWSRRGNGGRGGRFWEKRLERKGACGNSMSWTLMKKLELFQIS